MNAEAKKIQLAVMWHMHQPDYREAGSQSMVLPWVRLHALKDYYDMPARLRAFPSVKQTFNVVPSMIEQIECYLSGDWSDRELDLFKVAADQLTSEQKETILESFFMAPPETMIRPYNRYAALYEDYRSIAPKELIHRWNASDWRDLQFWRQLSWFDPLIRREDPEIQSLFDQGVHFSEDQKVPLLDRMMHWIGRSVEIYRELQDSGQIEVSVTPYYHPILPLLIDPSSTHEAMPGASLHANNQCHPEDARAQMEKAITFYEQRYGRKPRGVWPSEGSVSQAVADLMQDLGIEWFASDEAILGRSIGSVLSPSPGKIKGDRYRLYYPYRVNSGKGPAMVFRDHALSDLVGFDYHQHWEPRAAAKDFIAQLHSIRDHWEGEGVPLVTVILDGENCWEYYPNDGEEFLNTLYAALEEDPTIESVTVSEGIASRKCESIDRLSAGSWINGNFHIWIGEEADRKGWFLVEEARKTLVQAQTGGGIDKATLQKAWEEIYIAEGSDWYWWFGDTHSTEQIGHFDRMFRQHLIHVYELLGMRAPGELLLPIEKPKKQAAIRLESEFPSPPQIDGKESHYYEWKSAIEFEPAGQSGAMKSAEQSGVQRIYYGGDQENFYLRVDTEPGLTKREGENTWEVSVTNPASLRLRFSPEKDGYQAAKTEESKDANSSQAKWSNIEREGLRAMGKNLFEACIPWSELNAEEADSISFYLTRSNKKGESEMIPSLSTLTLKRPGRASVTRPWFP
ncbi:MAG: glycoside hydrolase [Candidatus Omnitrophica bacterium]|nr:glycoside hydrolase [Candidatus Omnitrophota bacterium]